MYAQLFDPEDMSWKQVLAMGREMLPDHPLFAAAPEAGDSLDSDSYDAAPAERDEVDWDGGGADTAAGQADVGSTQQFSVEDVSRLAEENRARFDAVEQEQDDMSIDMDVSSLEEPEAAPARGDSGASDDGYDLDIPDSTDSGGIDLDMGDSDLGGADSDDAAATKLELARAYLDMGDVEGARGMLEEVVNEGNAGQRAEAKRLLDEVR